MQTCEWSGNEFEVSVPDTVWRYLLGIYIFGNYSGLVLTMYFFA